MNPATVQRIISLIPDRTARLSSGAMFTPEGKSERVALIARLMHWLSPLDALTVENQQFLGLRSNSARPVDAELDAEGADLADEIDDIEEQAPVRSPGAGTQIAA
jgi:hypothetical protein